MIDPTAPAEAHETLDPADLDGLRALAHRMVDDAFEDLTDLRQRPVWRPLPDELAPSFETPAPRAGVGVKAAYERYRADVRPYLMGNDHPRFWGWYMGNGTMVGALGAFLAAAANPNLGGGNHAAVRVEQQVVRWCADVLGFPLDAGGLMVSGASMANLVGWTVARHVHAGVDVRAEGVAAIPEPLVAYASVEVHSCHKRAAEVLGLGSNALRLVPTDGAYRIDLAALRRAIDDLDALADLCAEEGLRFHVDGAIGAMIGLAPALAPLQGAFDAAGLVGARVEAIDLETRFEDLPRTASRRRSAGGQRTGMRTGTLPPSTPSGPVTAT